jgi:6-pyruvoyltetrahydropterin/6-carboxytetrahydropterin synthase
LTTVTCTRRLTFEAGHRVFQHESKCAHFHGHSYKALIEAEGPLDAIGRVIDFSVLKERIGRWIDGHFDHGFLVWDKDTDAIQVLSQLVPVQKIYPLPYNPTAENIAKFLLEDICPFVLDGTGVTVTRVVIHETENCSAEARLA